MALIRRADRCYWIDVTEVTEGQYAAYLAANPAPVNDALCSAPPDPESQCEGRAPADTRSELPMTCVDWCDADAFCKWAGKTLCRDDFIAIWPEVLNESDFLFACTEGGSKRAPHGPSCGEQACTVGGEGPIKAGQTSNCSVPATEGPAIHDLLGNVEEWTDSCHSNVPRANCTVRGGSFARFDALRCCDQKTELFRRRRLATLGFRCCAYP
jgi:formylglycine-generating enzyme